MSAKVLEVDDDVADNTTSTGTHRIHFTKDVKNAIDKVSSLQFGNTN